MCFSAPASFIGSAGLAAIGVGSLAIAKKEDRFLAVVPLFFAVQQSLEGIQWLHLNSGTSSILAGYGYLFFAYILWPIYTPVFVYISDKRKQKVLKWFIFLGIIVALYFLYLSLLEPLTISNFKECISYNFNVPLRDWADLAYLVSIFGPLFISSKEYFKWFGIVIAISALIAWIFFATTFASVWCFFSAIVSSMFFLYIKYRKHE
jgi:hypothetical protein